MSSRLAPSLISKWLQDGAGIPCYRVALPKAFQRLDENGGELAWKRGGALNEVWHCHCINVCLVTLVQESWGLELLEGALKLLEARTMKMAMIR